MRLPIFISAILSILIQSCSTLQDSTLLGVGIGSIIGASFGAAAGHSKGVPIEGAALGLAAGAATGGLVGFLHHKKTEELKFKPLDSSISTTPSLTTPRVERVWVPARIENETYIEGHFQYVIQRPSRWRAGDFGGEDPRDQSNIRKGKGK